MGVIILMIGISISIAVTFLVIFLWNMKSGQYDDTYTPSVRMLFDDKKRGSISNETGLNHKALIKKYDVPVPRYTSYPTVPCWDESLFSEKSWWSAVERCFKETNDSNGISLYVHLPFCESLCTYCACNTRITRNHKVEEKYIEAVLNEWYIYKSHFSHAPLIRELHLGGGTPTFFSPANLETLIRAMLKGCVIHPKHEFSFEGHPNNTTFEHLKVLYDLGFERVSFGVQDLDLRVQKAINRIQPFENLQRAVENARAVGYKSISFDLIYGLPYQTLSSVQETVSKAIQLKPDRIAFYSYAHVPWLKPGQRGYEDADLPSDIIKRSLYDEGRKLFLEAGYLDIGMDHFSLVHDALAIAHKGGTLHRNFMGYTTTQTDLLIGLGTSSISDAKYAYAQNLKKVEDYVQRVNSGASAIFKGHIQSEEDRERRKLILDIVCQGKANLRRYRSLITEEEQMVVKEMQEEGILNLAGHNLQVTELGRPFIRNIAAIFDRRMKEKARTASPLFSKAI
jgi:oxygen-independent coproporphyrinogen III oxidase